MGDEQASTRVEQPPRQGGNEPPTCPAFVWRLLVRREILLAALLRAGGTAWYLRSRGVPCGQPNITQRCFGPGGCEGGQTCRSDLTWSECDCTSPSTQHAKPSASSGIACTTFAVQTPTSSAGAALW